jgi:predicted O-linked N-acetylglucosamine transferase (SPINDLY family)
MSNSEQRLQAALANGDWPLMVRLCRQALRKNADSLLAHRFLGFALHKLHHNKESVTAFEKAVVHWPSDAELLLNFGQTLLESGHEFRAVPLLEKVCGQRPDKFVVWLKMSQALYRTQSNSKGYECALKAEALAQTDQERAMALVQKAIHRRELGQVKEAIKDCEVALKLNPNDTNSHTDRLLFMLADPDVTALDLRRAAAEYALTFEEPLKPSWPTHDATTRQPWERLRIGFISPDFRNHSVMYFVEGLLAQLDRRQFTVMAFHLHTGSDLVTERVKKHVDVFVDLANRDWNEQAKLVKDNKPDILIDLAGHTGNNGLHLMAMKLAPLQISWLGYPATTGLTAIDYKFTDEVTDPVGDESEYSENLFRLNTFFCCYRPHVRNPLWRYQPAFLVQPTPALANGYITFGSCNNLGKLSDTVLELWGKLLQDLPTARLLIEGKNFDKPEFCEQYKSRCERLGIPVNRLMLVPLDNRNQYLTYHRIDIALDPFPLTGGTTTFDLLWMGIPLVSLEGDSFKSRLSTGLLSYLGQTEWLATSTAGYLEIAKKLAANVNELNTLRLSLRAKVEALPLMNEEAFNTQWANGLRSIWLHWLAKSRCPDDSASQQTLMQNWLEDKPEIWRCQAPFGVGVATGERLDRGEAYQRLQKLLDNAKAATPLQSHTSDGQIKDKHWIELTEFAETVLSAIPNDAVALTCLAEVELAHGHADFAVTYLRYAQNAMADAK